MSEIKVKTKKKMKTKDKVLLIVSIVMIVVSALALAAVVLMNTSLFEDPNVGSGGMTQSFVTPEPIQEKTMNFLICGIDYTTDRSSTRLSDVIMVANYDISAKKINIIQIPRDTYVADKYPTGKTNKINAIYNQKKGGINVLMEVINDNLGLPIDHYVTVTMDSFRGIVNALGGIEVDSPFAFTRKGQTIVKGKQIMDGEKAQVFVRERKLLPNGDADRQRSQRAFLSGLMDELLQATPGELAKMIPTLITEVKTDLKATEMIDLAKQVQGLQKSDIVFHSTPGSFGMYEVSSGQRLSVYSMNKEKTAELLNQYFRPYSDPIPAEELGIIQIFDKVTYEDDAQNMDETGASKPTSSSSNANSNG